MIKVHFLQKLQTMYKSSTTAKAQYNKADKSSRERQISLSQASYKKKILDANRNSQDDLTQLENSKFTLHEIKNRAKIALIDFIKTQMKISIINEETFKGIEEISSTGNIHKMFQNTFLILRQISEEQLKLHMEQKEVIIAVRGKESTKIKITRQQDSKKKTRTAKQLQQLQVVNQSLKKQLFYLKQDKNALEKRMMGLIQEFKTRKNFYIAQIKKLTDIISMSPFDIRKLVMTKTKEARQLQQRQQRQKNDKSSNLVLQNSVRHDQINILQPRKYPTGTSFTHKKQDSIAYQSEYNSEMKPLKQVSSIQHLQQQRNDLN